MMKSIVIAVEGHEQDVHVLASESDSNRARIPPTSFNGSSNGNVIVLISVYRVC